MSNAKPALRTATLSGVTVPFEVHIRPRRTRAAIQVTADRTVRVLLPPGVPLTRADQLIRMKSAWVLTHLTAPPPAPPPPFHAGGAVRVQGRLMPVRVDTSAAWGFHESPDGEGFQATAIASAPAEAVEAFIRTSLATHLIRRAKAESTRLVACWHPRVGGPAPRRVLVRDYRSRWGVCRPDGTIAFNWRLIQAPPECFGYVVVHELTHLTHPHHQSAFWRALEAVLPDHRDPRRWLNAHGPELYW
jgi:predicted metal-dependent hydrolase